MRIPFALLIPFLFASLVSAADPGWLTRDGSGRPVVSGITFEREVANALNARVLGTHNTACKNAGGCNYLFWNVRADGYAGRPPGSCLTPGQCPEMEDQDVGHIWGSGKEKTVLIHGVELKNAFKVRHDPHVDTLQIFQGGHNAGRWPAVIQNTILRNSDDQILLTGNMTLHTLVLQNVLIEEEQWFENDCKARAKLWAPLHQACAANNVIGSTAPVVVWLISLRKLGPTPALALATNVARAIVIDSLEDDGSNGGAWKRHRTQFRGTVAHYASIEDALAAGETEPPFLEASCSGWLIPPVGCSSTLGPDDGSSSPPPPPDPEHDPEPIPDPDPRPAGVSAGPDLQIAAGETATLEGSVSDPNAFRFWRKISGPGAVHFGHQGFFDSFESGNVERWINGMNWETAPDDAGNHTGHAFVEANDFAKSGAFSWRAQNKQLPRTNQNDISAKLLRWRFDFDRAYFSGWLFFPEDYNAIWDNPPGEDYLNIFQFKERNAPWDPSIILAVVPSADHTHDVFRDR